MGFLDSIGSGIKGYFNKNAEQQAMMEELQQEADRQRLLAFKEQFAIDSKQVAIAQAKKDSAEKSGLQKLRAENRMRRLNDSDPIPGTLFEKLSNITKNNKARTQKNLERTKAMRETAGKMNEERLGKMNVRTQQPFSGLQPLRDRKPTWNKM